MKKHKLILAILSILTLIAFARELPIVKAAGEAVTLTPSALTDSTATNVLLEFTPDSEYSIGDTVSITLDSGATLSLSDTLNTDIDGDSTSEWSTATPSISGQTYTYTFEDAGTTQSTTNGADFYIKITASTGNYYVSFSDSNGNYGTALVYVGSANQVSVTAQVEPSLAFVIRNSSNSANINSCALGTLTLTTVEECSYRLKITTNLDAGYAVQINSDGALVSGANDIDAITDDTGTVTAGAEDYGIALTAGSATGGSITESNTTINYQSDDSPIPTSATALFSSDGPNDPQSNSTYTALITHRAAINGATASGNYTQTVTYTVASNF